MPHVGKLKSIYSRFSGVYLAVVHHGIVLVSRTPFLGKYRSCVFFEQIFGFELFGLFGPTFVELVGHLAQRNGLGVLQ